MSRDLAGRYRLDEIIGRGATSTVWRATDLLLGRTVAAKLLADDVQDREELRARFRREAQQVAALHHPGIVVVFDFGADGDALYLVMELVAGTTLADLIRRGPLPPARAVSVVGDLLSALSYAHGQGIVHRDVKPSNILLDPDGHARLSDFGIAKPLTDATELTDYGRLMGTLSYLSPEQVDGRQAEPRSDLYSCGCVLYECAVGRPPFTGSALEVLLQHRQAPAPLICDRLGPEGAPLDVVVQRALHKQPDGRFASAAEMHQALVGAAPGESAGSRGTGGRRAGPPRVGEAPHQRLRSGVHHRRERLRAAAQRLTDRRFNLLTVLAVAASVAVAAAAGTFVVAGGTSPGRRRPLVALPNAVPVSQVELPVVSCTGDPSRAGPGDPPAARMAIPQLDGSANWVGAYYEGYLLADRGLGVVAPPNWACRTLSAYRETQVVVAPSPAQALGRGRSSDTIAVSAFASCARCDYDRACPVFTSATAADQWVFGPCPGRRPPGERVTFLNSTVARFWDPPGTGGGSRHEREPTVGLLTYGSGVGQLLPSYEVTCTVSRLHADLCAEVVDEAAMRLGAG